MGLIADIIQDLSVWLFEGPVVVFKLLMLYMESIYNFVVPVGVRAKEVHGDTVLITGGGSGIGRLIAIKLAQRGCCIVIWDVNTTGNEETARMIREQGGAVHAYTVDLCDRQSIYKCADLVKREVGDVDILINNAGIVSAKKLLDTPDEMIERTMNVNVNAHFWTVKAFMPAMVKNNHGHIVTIASLAGLVGVNGLVDYHASKFAAVGFDEALRDEISCMGADIQTTCVCPFFINTGMFDGVTIKMPITLPLLDQEYVSNKVVDAILTNQKLVCLPKILYVILAIKWWIPTKGLAIFSKFTGAADCMDTFVGRKRD